MGPRAVRYQASVRPDGAAVGCADPRSPRGGVGRPDSGGPGSAARVEPAVLAPAFGVCRVLALRGR